MIVNNPVKMTFWKCTDGQTYEEREDAERHQAILDFYETIEADPLYGSIEGSKIEGDQLIHWLGSHREVVCRALGIVNL